jgi:hypothetical protein
MVPFLASVDLRGAVSFGLGPGVGAAAPGSAMGTGVGIGMEFAGPFDCELGVTRPLGMDWAEGAA